MKIRFVVLGEPQGKGRPKFSRIGSRVIARTPDETVLYENLIQTEYLRQCGKTQFPDCSSLDMRILAFFSIPRSASKKRRALMLTHKIRPTKKPDWDNIGKVVADSLNKVAYTDDSHIADAQVRKFYSDRPRIEVTIQTTPETEEQP